ncbi:DNRLRE domain-containing protein [Micromonospora phytophila]|uniref:DNRLRE domain-containing protein n=1 Tax=Micromonospora phytophila TaxID=709888 RepID=UPI002030279B|nr:DNRLRE domain-containing protein [Micromonospora phytophila]MCM0674484.1 DNRLRE domain-containing protein [Micromonospora phytophila]
MHEHGGSTGVPARRRRVPRRILTTGLAALLTATGAVVATGQPAAAAPIRWVLPTHVSYTDAARPTTAFPTTAADVPVGTWEADGAKHTSRAYFTFDLTPYQGKQVIHAVFQTGESSVDDCDKPREVELWRTDTPATAPTWDNAPVVHEKVGDIGTTAPCPAGYLELSLTETLRQAVDDGRDSLTLMARIKGDHEENKHYARRMDKPGVSLDANAAPDVPGKLTVAGLACADGRMIGTTTPVFSAEVTDPDKVDGYAGDPVTATFAWWPVDRPTERTEWTSYSMYAPARFTYSVPSELMVNGGTYAYAVRGTDKHASSDWSPACRFTVDTTAPPAPEVTSTDYPSGWNWPGHGGPGIPGRFTFTAKGADDVAGFRYGPFGATTLVAADASGTATITWTPDNYGPRRLYVQTVDRTGNRSPVTVYEFIVRNTAPTVTDGNPEGRLGQARVFTFAPNMTDVAEYVWRLNDGTERTVAADAEGKASVSVTPTTPSNILHVRSRTRSGSLSGDAGYRFTVRTQPFVGSEKWPLDQTVGAPVGTRGSFVFTPAMDDVTEYVYSFDYGDPQTVAAGEDGSATVTYTPETAYHHTIQVFSRTNAGVESATADLSFQVASLAPTAESTVYPRNMAAGGPGVTGAFTFRPHPQSSGVTEYVYTFRGEPERTVQAGPDGTATIEWTPGSAVDEWGGWNELRVRARTASGVTTDAEYYLFRVDPLSPMIVSDVFNWQGGAVVGQTGDFVFTAQLPGTTEFVYSFDGGPEQTVVADATGTARVTWTADSAYNHSLTVRSRTATGLTSGSAYYNIWIDQNWS